MFEAMLFVCVAMVTAPDPCAFMNVAHRELNSRSQCHFWIKQGVGEIQTSEHYREIVRALGNPKADTLYIKGECHEEVLQQPFVCKDCEL
tara:strand:+ start:28376 stop:28645 length:270 start_codon:yes stop_codon:yes gene_type:complete